MDTKLNRRRFLKSTAIIAGGLSAGVAKADVVAGQDGFSYEVMKSDAEWRAQLGDYAFSILREGKTEKQRASPLWDDRREGRFTCKGCDLDIYHSRYRVFTDKGWLFYRVAQPNAVLTAIDGPDGATMDPNLDVLLAENPGLGSLFSNEVHCRRCGSHMGHIFLVDGQILHCINGESLNLVPAPKT